ncbi:MAG: HNH endonuclease [Candidatus Pacearchaeota archaeon]|jgi:hypothetical protein
MPKKGYIKTEEHRKKLSNSILESDKGFQKGHQTWNKQGKGRLKRKFKRVEGKMILNSHHVWLMHNNLKTIPKGYIIHHKDLNSMNDDISNLILMTDIDHKKLHGELDRKRFMAEEKLI